MSLCLNLSLDTSLVRLSYTVILTHKNEFAVNLYNNITYLCVAVFKRQLKN